MAGVFCQGIWPTANAQISPARGMEGPPGSQGGWCQVSNIPRSSQRSFHSLVEAADYTANSNLIVKVLDFIQLGGSTWTVGRTIFEMRLWSL